MIMIMLLLLFLSPVPFCVDEEALLWFINRGVMSTEGVDGILTESIVSQAVVSIERINEFLCTGDLRPDNIVRDSQASE